MPFASSSASSSSVACSKTLTNSFPMIFRFVFRIGHAFEQFQETIGGIDVLEANVKILAENALHHFFLARAEQAVVDENAGELVADRLVQERRRDR